MRDAFPFLGFFFSPGFVLYLEIFASHCDGVEFCLFRDILFTRVMFRTIMNAGISYIENSE